jgi:hypothetical protein
VPPIPPLAACPGSPVVETVAAGTRLWRIHEDRFDATQMNPRARPHVEAGGRFDSVDGSYAYLYLGDSPEAAIAETLCRSLFGTEADRIVPAITIRRRVLSALVVVQNLTVTSAHGADLNQLGQDLWLTKCNPADYLLTRAWAAAILSWTVPNDGLGYRCRNDEDRHAWVLMTDPGVSHHPNLAGTGEQLLLDTPEGRAILRRTLVTDNATLG